MSNSTITRFGCDSTLRFLDSYLDNQLGAEESAFVSRHLQSCAGCAHELEVRRGLRGRLRDAVRQQAVSPYLQTRVLANVRAGSRRSPWFGWQRQAGLAAAALVLVFCTSFIAWNLGYLRWTDESQAAFIDSISARIPRIMTVGLRNHVHCSVYRKYSKQPPPLEKVIAHLPSAYRPVVDVVSKHVPAGFRVVTAHECGYDDRKVVHIGLKSPSRLMSLIITPREQGDRFTDADLGKILSAAGSEVYSAGVQRFQIAALETPGHLAYLVSDLPSDENGRLLIALAPELRSFLNSVRA